MTVAKWGNSLGVRIPRALAADARLAEGTAVDLRVENGRLVAVPVADPVTLGELLAGITPENVHDETFDDAPRGREVW
ncbi:MAG TPA: AbrB/MazE/SpoVT family DNA-binding domain-containing protein [Gemmatirosa sp.]